jgi:hypothetical protein
MDPTKSDESTNKPELQNLAIKEIELTSDDIFVNLRLISKIDVGNKLIQTDKHVNIDTSYFQPITRWCKGANRNDTIKFMNLVFTKAYKLNDKLLEDKSEDSIQTLLRLNSDLKNSLTGLINLKHTYSTDKLIQSEIDVMMDDIQSRLDTNLKHINFIRPTGVISVTNNQTSNLVNNSTCELLDESKDI